jgi:hypothetical protein
MSPETLALFRELLDQVSIPSTHPDPVGAATRIVQARKELEEAMQATLPAKNGSAVPA